MAAVRQGTESWVSFILWGSRPALCSAWASFCPRLLPEFPLELTWRGRR